MYNYIIGLGSRHCLYKPSPAGTRLWYDMTYTIKTSNHIMFHSLISSTNARLFVLFFMDENLTKDFAFQTLLFPMPQNLTKVKIIFYHLEF